MATETKHVIRGATGSDEPWPAEQPPLAVFPDCTRKHVIVKDINEKHHVQIKKHVLFLHILNMYTLLFQ
jgi:hypothetical protein